MEGKGVKVGRKETMRCQLEVSFDFRASVIRSLKSWKIMTRLL